MTNPTILLVESENSRSLTLESHLHALGYAVRSTSAESGLVLPTIEATQPDLILLDLDQAGSDMVAVATMIRIRWQLPVIFLAPEAGPGLLSQIRAGQPYHCLLKPLDIDELHIAMSLALQQSATRRALHSNGRMMANTLSSIGDGLIVTDAAGRVSLLNPVAEWLTGLPSREAVGRPLTEVFAAIDEQSGAPLDDLVLQAWKEGGLRLVQPTLLRSHDGRLWPIDNSVAPIYDDAGLFNGVVIVFREVSAQRMVEASLRRQAQDVAILRDLGSRLQACDDLPAAFEAVAQAARQLFPGDSGTLFAYHSEQSTIKPMARWGESSHTGAEINCWAVTAGAAHLPDPQRPNTICTAVPCPIARRSACFPIILEGRSLGVLHLYNPPRQGALAENPKRAAQSRERLARALVEQAALGMTNILLRQALREQAIRDPLTGLFNRRFLEESFSRELHRAARNAYPIGIMLIDVDHFKQINDSYGHAAGDTVLRVVGHLLQAGVRAEDLVCRYGGEEFVIVLAAADAATTCTRAEQLRAAVAQQQFQDDAQSLPQITISIGITTISAQGGSLEIALREADQALYKAKNTGRNRVAIKESGTYA